MAAYLKIRGRNARFELARASERTDIRKDRIC